MKNLTTAFLLFISLGLLAQTSDNPSLIEFDFSTKKFNLNYPVEITDFKKGQFYQVRINNINQNLYNIKLENKDSTISSTVSLPTFGSLGLDGLSALVEGIKNSTNATIKGIQVKIDSLEDEKSTLNYKLLEIANDYRSDFNKSNVDKEMGMLLDQAEIRSFRSNNSNNIQRIYENYKNVQKKVEEIDQKILSLEEKIEQEVNSDRNKIITKINESSNDMKIWVNRANDTIQRLDLVLTKLNMFKFTYFIDDTSILKCLKTTEDLCQFEKDLKVYRSKLIDFKKNVNNVKTILDTYIGEIPARLDLMKVDSSLKVAYAQFVKNQNEALTLIDKSLEQITSEKVSAYFQQIIHMENNIVNTWTSMPMQFLEDVATFEINITPKSTDYGLSSYKQEYQFPVSDNYIGVSGGFYFAFGFRNERYSILETKVGDISNFEIVDEKSDNAEVGFTTLLHFGQKFSKSETIGYHFSVGPAISISSVVRPRVCLGGGFSFGKYRNMITIDALFMAGYNEAKSNLYNLGQVYLVKPDQTTISKLGVSIALSLGYIYKF